MRYTTQVLMATAAALMRRTPSVVQPHLFTFEDHFDFEAVIGRTPHSEVYRARHKLSSELFAVKRSMRQFRSRADRDRWLHALCPTCVRRCLDAALLQSLERCHARCMHVQNQV